MIKLACKDLEIDCQWTISGKTKEDVIKAVKKHLKKEHNLPDTQINSKQIADKIELAIIDEHLENDLSYLDKIDHPGSNFTVESDNED